MAQEEKEKAEHQEAFFVKELNAFHEKHPVHSDVYYVERFCACGAIRKIRAHQATLWNAEKTGIIDQFDAAHSKPPHKPVTEEAAKKQREMTKAAMGGR